MHRNIHWQIICLLIFPPVTANALESEFYGSIRIQAEHVNPDNAPDNFNDYSGLRDAYSRVGLKLTQPLNDNWSTLFQVELPLDMRNMDVQDPWGQEEDIRILKLQLSGPYGSLWYGQDWMPYYNAIAYPVDYFSSYYSGFATFTTFRLEETISYASPSLHGFHVFSCLIGRQRRS